MKVIETVNEINLNINQTYFRSIATVRTRIERIELKRIPTNNWLNT